MFSSDWVQEIIALLLCVGALAFMLRGFRGPKKPKETNVQLGSKLQRGLRKAEKRKK